jgi:hypothetical protein
LDFDVFITKLSRRRQIRGFFFQTPKGDAGLSAEVGQAISFRLRVGKWEKYSSKKTSTAKLLTFQTYTS